MPKVYEQAYKFVTLDAFINFRLCGEMVTEPSNARYGPIDHSTLKWSDEISESVGLPIDKLAEIAQSGKLIGEISDGASKSTGLRKGTPVIMGCGDQQCSALGTGTIKPGIVKATTGTGTFVITHTEDYMEEPYVMYSNPSAIPGEWILEGVVPGTGAALKWYRDQYYQSDAILAGKAEGDIYEMIESSAADIPAGSDGLVVFPFMAIGKGIFYNLGFEHSKAHIARAIMEANGYGIRFYTKTMETMLDIEFGELCVQFGATLSLYRNVYDVFCN
ncbi:MAG: FGGY family carbohydrate kinase, partial [Candidatus Hodarchaeota archaeon]